MKRKIMLGDREVEYELIRKKVKNINLRIRSDMSITVSAATSVQIQVIERFLHSRADFICRALDRFQRNRSKNNVAEYNDNDTVRLFGESLALKLIKGERAFAEKRAGAIYLTVKDPEDTTERTNAMNKFFRVELYASVEEMLRRVIERFDGFDIAAPKITVRDMKTRWGSCNSVKGRVSINLRLVQYPRECLEFVLCHELCHLVHPNHSKGFYQLLGSVMPDWRARAQKLKEGC